MDRDRPATAQEADAFRPEGRPHRFEQGRIYAVGATVPWYVPKRLIARWAARNGFGGIEAYPPGDPRTPFRPADPRPYGTMFVFQRVGPTATFGLPDEIVWVAEKPLPTPAAPKFRVERRKS